MTYDEAKQRIVDICGEPDTAMVKILPVLDEMKKDYEALLSLQAEMAKRDDRIRDLQDTNHKLFLAQTGKSIDADGDGDEEEIEGPEAIDKFIEKLKED